ncbi:diguanylate cyclase (GGDEF) domain-containing protein [Pleurocapsa sp. PCC 7327]|nr:diguanylate cyclase (GGDEF) domain-containing protein [Pleurocapsa sp. PCC 7327]
MQMQTTVEAIVQSSPLTLSPSTSVTEAIAAMNEARTSCVLVVDNQKLVGILTERDVVKVISSGRSLEKLTLADLMTQTVISLKSSEIDNIFTVSELFNRYRIRHLPILDDRDRLMGIVTPQSIRNVLKPEYLLRYIQVAEVMARNVICGSPNDTVLQLTQQMALHRVSCIVIVNANSSIPVGIVTERDIIKLHASKRDFARLSAQTVMSAPLSTVQPQSSLWIVHQRMQELQVRRLVVTEPTGELAGIVTQTQLLKRIDPAQTYHVMEQMQQIIDRQTSELKQLNEKLRAANQELHRLATIDELTNVANRRYFNEYFAREWKRLARCISPLSLILCDVDRFKCYNDIYGHPAGDRCLVQVAQTLSQVIKRPTDLVARYGGEEFAIVLPDTNLTGAEHIAKAILTQVQQLQIPHVASSNGYITVSLGVATTIPTQNSLPDMLLEMADRVLYQSKQRGRNTYSLNV